MSSSLKARKSANGAGDGSGGSNGQAAHHSSNNGHSNGNGQAAPTTGSRAKFQHGYRAFGVDGSHVSWTWSPLQPPRIAALPQPSSTTDTAPVLSLCGCRWMLTMAGMIIVPLLVYWCWICLEYNKGSVILPYYSMLTPDLQSWLSFMSSRIAQKAVPSSQAWLVYLSWTLFQALLFKFGPGHRQRGVVLSNGERLEYCFNGQFAFFTTLCTAAALHYTGFFRLTVLVDLFPQMLTVCIVWCSLVIAAIYLAARLNGSVENQTDSLLYDYFMGPQLNPHLLPGTWLSFDIKFFYELRPGIMHWFFTSLAFALRQYEEKGEVSLAMLCICFYHLCFVNACYKGEHCVIWTMDIIHEKFGWMLLMLDIVMVPFVFPMQAYYVYRADSAHHPLYLLFFLLMHCLGYYIFDTANSQKDYFREKKEEAVPSGFPRLPWGRISHPRFIQTERGTRLLVDGWWAYARHCNYLGDLLMSWSWGLTCGYSSIFPFAYTAYLTPLLIHREIRDDRECKEKYGDDWEKYKQLVPWRICPYVY